MNWKTDKDFEQHLKSLKLPSAPERVHERLIAEYNQREKIRLKAKLTSQFKWVGYLAAACITLVFGLAVVLGKYQVAPSAGIAADTGESADSLGIDDASSSSTKDLASMNGFKPIVAENTLKDRIDEGIVYMQDGVPARRYRYEFLDRVVWKNESNGSVIEMEVPREEFVLVPVQTF